MSDEQREGVENADQPGTGERERLAPPGSPGGAAAVSSVLWGIIAFIYSDSIVLGLLVFLAVLTSLEAVAGFTTDRAD